MAHVKTSTNSTRRQTGAIRYIAPERYKRNNRINEKTDVFAFAMTSYQILTGRIPFFEESDQDIVKDWIKDGERPGLPENAPTSLWQIIETCWSQNHEERPTFKHVSQRLTFLLKGIPNVTVSAKVDINRDSLFSSGMTTAVESNDQSSSITEESLQKPVETPSNAARNLPLETPSRRSGHASDVQGLVGIPGSSIAGAIESLYEEASRNIDRENSLKMSFEDSPKLVRENSSEMALKNSSKMLHESSSTNMSRENSSKVIRENSFSRMDLESSSSSVTSEQLYALGMSCFESKDYKSALKYFRDQTLQQHPQSLQKLGVMFLHGLGTEPNVDSAIWYLKRAAELGNPSAFNTLGIMYRNDIGVSANYSLAMEFFKRAGDLGDPSGYNNLGLMYKQAVGIPQPDYIEALRLFQLAASYNVPVAIYNVGVMHYQGLGVECNFKIALDNFMHAASLGFGNAEVSIAEMHLKGKGVLANAHLAYMHCQNAENLGIDVEDLKRKFSTLLP